MLQSVHDRNEILFYRILEDNFDEMAPIIYTPTVGWACSHFSQVYRSVSLLARKKIYWVGRPLVPKVL